VPNVLIASDAVWVHDEIRSAIPRADVRVQGTTSGASVRAIVGTDMPDLVVLDSQIGNMGAMAVCMDLRLEESGGRLHHVPVLILLDRQPDVFLAKMAKADGWLVKPLDPIRTRKAITALLAGGTYVDRVQVGDAGLNYRPTPDATAR
jgi:DNA-binding response OmpR family regulator